MTLQSNDEPVKRQYRSPRREAQAGETKLTIIEAALRLFTEQGFRTTTIKQVAEEAGVSEQTVYNAVGDKLSLLYEVGSYAMSAVGSTEASGFLEALSGESDPIQRIRMTAGFSRQQWQEGALEIDLLLSSGELRDPRIVELAEQSVEYRLEVNRAICAILFPDSIRDPRFSVDEIATFATAVDAAPTIKSLRTLGWTMDDYEDWISKLLTVFLEDDSEPR